MDKITFENATLVNPAKVTIDGVDYEVTPEETTGGTPASANIFNTMQENIEKSVVAVGITQPSTNEKVWLKAGKNHFDENNITKLLNCTYSNGVVTQSQADTASEIKIILQTYMNETYVNTVDNKTAIIGTMSYTFTKNDTFNSIRFGAHGSTLDTKIQVNISNLTNGETYTLSFDLTNITQGSISWKDIQIEQGLEATEYEGHVDKEILVKNDNGVFERFADIDEIENSIFDTGWIPIQFTSNDWKAREGSAMYAPKFRKIGNVVFLQGQFATNQILNPGTYNIVTTNLPEPDKQHTICTCAYTGKLVNMWIVGKTISLRVFDNNFNDAIGVSIDSCYIEYT